MGLAQLFIALLIYFQNWLDTSTNVAVLVNGLLMIYLRWLTDQPIASVSPKLDKMRPTINHNKRRGKYGSKAKDQ